MVVAVCEVISWTAIFCFGNDILIVIATSMYHDMKLMYQDMELMYQDMVHKFHVLVQRL